MFEYYGNIQVHVYCPGLKADGPLGSILFSQSLICSPTVLESSMLHAKFR